MFIESILIAGLLWFCWREWMFRKYMKTLEKEIGPGVRLELIKACNDALEEGRAKGYEEGREDVINELNELKESINEK